MLRGFPLRSAIRIFRAHYCLSLYLTDLSFALFKKASVVLQPNIVFSCETTVFQDFQVFRNCLHEKKPFFFFLQ